MSKAFTRESDDFVAPEIIFPTRSQPTASNRPITKEGVARFENNLRRLNEEKQMLLDNTGEAKKDALLGLDIKIQRLQSLLAGVVIAPPPVDFAKVAFGAFVRIREGDGEEETYQIVGMDEADPEEGRISSVSPLARALLSVKAGDKVRFQSPAGPRELTILQVHY